MARKSSGWHVSSRTGCTADARSPKSIATAYGIPQCHSPTTILRIRPLAVIGCSHLLPLRVPFCRSRPPTRVRARSGLSNLLRVPLAGYAFSTSSRSSTGAAATFEQLLACKSGQPAGALCSFWECNDPLTFGPMLTYHGGSAYQSSTEWDGDAMRAVDGNTDGNFWDGSVTYTAYGAPGGWWQANLGERFANHVDRCLRADRLLRRDAYRLLGGLQDAEGYTVATNVNSGTATITYPTPQRPLT